MPPLSVESIIHPPDSSYPLYLTAKRYFVPDSDSDGWTLFLLHATTSHKESWEPTIQKIFDLFTSNKGKQKQGKKLREAWCLDCPNHGEGGRLNERILQREEEWYLNFSCEKYAQAVHHFLSAGPVDFSARKLVGIGHSLGGNAISLLQSLASPSLKNAFKSLIIIEPMLSPAGPEHLKKLRLALIKGAYERRDVWPDRATAMAALKRRERTVKWDPRILEIFVKYGIRPHPGSLYPVCPYPGVTLACTREQEAAMYRDPDGATKPVVSLTQACKEKPVHLILGGIRDFMPQRTHDALLDPKSGRTFASVTILPEVGHLIPLEVPDRLGEVIFDALVKNKTFIPSETGAKAKL